MNASRLSAILVPPRTTTRNLFLLDHFDFRLPPPPLVFFLSFRVSRSRIFSILEELEDTVLSCFLLYREISFVSKFERQFRNVPNSIDPKTSRKLDPNINFIGRIEFVRVKNNANGRVEPRDRFYKSRGWGNLYVPIECRRTRRNARNNDSQRKILLDFESVMY